MRPINIENIRNKSLFLIVFSLTLFILQHNKLTAQTANTLDRLDLTSSTPAAAAYSLRKLSTSYTGFAIKVRRSSDNALLDIGFDSNGDLDQVTLLNFVGTGNGFVQTWYDQSGLDNNAIQITATLQPTIVSSGSIYKIGNRPAIFVNNSQLTFNTVAIGTIVSVLSVDPSTPSLGTLASVAGVDKTIRRTITQPNGWRAVVVPSGSDLAIQIGSFRNGDAATGVSDGGPMIPNEVGIPSLVTFNTYYAPTTYAFLGTLFYTTKIPSRYLVGLIPEIILFPHTGTLATSSRQTIDRNQGLYYSISNLTSSKAISVCSNSAINYNAATYIKSPTFSVPFKWTRNTIAGIQNTAATADTSFINETLINTTASPIVVPYIFSITDPISGVSRFDTLNVTVNPSPILSNINTSVCSGSSLSVTPSGQVELPATTYTWAAPTVTGSITGATAQTNVSAISQTFTNNSAATGTVRYNIIPTSNGCSGPVFTTVVTVNPIPVLPNQTVSAQSAQTLNYQPIGSIVPVGTIYKWGFPVSNVVGGTINGGNSNLIGNSTFVQTLTNTSNVTGTTEYDVIPSINGCDGAPFKITVNVIPFNYLSNVGLPSKSASAAYSLRKLVGAYNGSAIQVRSSLDNSLLDIGFDSNGNLDTVSLKQFIGANSGFVSKWYDQTGNSRDLTQSVVANQPRIINNGIIDYADSKPTIRFLGVSGTVYNSLNLPTDLTTNGFISAAMNFTPGRQGFLLSSTTLFNYHSGSPSTLFSSNTSTSIKNGSTFLNGISVVPLSMPWVTRLSLIGIQPSQANVGTSWNNLGLDRGQRSLDGNFSELIIFPDTLTTNEKSQLLSNQGIYYLKPILTSTKNNAICSNGVFNYTATSITANTSFSWIRNAVNGISNPTKSGTTAIIIDTLVNTTNSPIDVEYIFTLTGPTGVTTIDTVKLTVNVSPLLSAATASVCSNTAFNVIPTGTVVVPSTTYTWTAPTITGSVTGGSAASNQAAISQNLSNATANPGTARYTVTPTALGCVGAPFTVTITVNPIPVMINAAIRAKSDTVINYTPTGTIRPTGTLYSWGLPTYNVTNGTINGATAQNDLQATFIQTLFNTSDMPGTATYQVTPNFSGCNGNPFNITVTVIPANYLDNVGLNNTIAAAVYSLRKLVSKYTGPAIQVRRSSDSTFQDIGFDTNNLLDTVALKNFISGSFSGFVSKWYDQSGNARDAVQTTPSLQPRIVNNGFIDRKNNLPTIFTNGLTTTLVTVDKTISVFNSGTISAVASLDAGLNNQGIIGNAISDFGIRAVGGSNTLENPATSSAFAFSSGGIGIYINRNLSPSGTNPTLLTTNSSLITAYRGKTKTAFSNGLAIGGYFTGNTRPWRGSISEIIVLDSLSNDTRITLEGNQSAFYFTPVLTSSTTRSICSNSQFSYTATSQVAGTSFRWSRLAKAGISNAATNGFTATINETLVNQTSDTLVVPYTITMTGPTGIEVSSTVFVTVNPIPVISNVAARICSGATFNVLPTSSIVPTGTTYTWSTAPSINISGGTITGGSSQTIQQTSISQTLTNSTVSNIGTATYTVRPSINGACLGNTFTVTVTVDPLLANNTISNPLSAIICNNTAPSNFTESTPTGGNGTYSYLWERSQDGINFSSAPGTNTNKNYLSPALTDTTWFRRVVSSGACNNVLSNVARIAVRRPLLVGTEPIATQVICNNVSSSISTVGSGGSLNYSYKWFSATSATDQSNGIQVSTNSVYTVPGTTIASNRYYFATITDNACGTTVNTSTATITTNPLVSVAVQPVSSIALCNNTSTTISTTATGGSANYGYQWYINATNSNTGGLPIAGAINAEYTVPPTTEAGIRYFYAVITDLNCTNTIATTVSAVQTRALLSVGNQPVASQSVCNNATVILSTTGTNGSGNYTFQWYSNTNNSNSGGTLLDSETNASFTVPATTDLTNRYYYAQISDATCSTTIITNPAEVLTYSLMKIATQPIQQQDICNNYPVNINILASGGSSKYGYQWFSSSIDNNTSGSIITDAKGAIYQVPATKISGNRFFYVSVLDSVCGTTLISNTANVFTNLALRVATQPVDSVIVCNNTDAEISTLAADGSLNYHYQWYYNSINDTTGATLIDGANQSNYIVPGSPTSGQRFFFAKITDVNCPNNSIVTSISRIVTRPGLPVSVGVQPAQNTPICINGIVNLQTLGSGGSSGNFLYQWYSNTNANTVDGTPIVGENKNTFSSTFNNYGNYYYYAIITDGSCGSSITTNLSTIQVNELPSISISLPSQTACQNSTSSVVPTLITGGAGLISYQWYSSTNSSTTNGVSLGANSGAQTSSFTPPTDNVGTNYYYVTANFAGSGCGTATSTSTHSAIVNFNAQPSDIEVVPANPVVCSGLTTNLKALLSASSQILNPQFTWYNDATLLSQADTGSNFTTKVLTNNTTYYVKVSGSNACANIPGNAKSQTVVVSSIAPEVVQPAIQSICAETNSNIISFTSSLSGTTFDWSNDNPSIGLVASGTGSIPSFLGINNGFTDITANITVTPSGNGCIGNSKTFPIIIKPISRSRDTTFSICSLNTLNYIPNNVLPNTRYTWTSLNNPIDISGITNESNPQTSFSQTLANSSNTVVDLLYQLVPISSNACNGPAFNVTIKSSPVPNIPNQTLSNPICSETGFEFTPINGVIPQTTQYTWTMPTSTPLSTINGGVNQLQFSSSIRANQLVNLTPNVASLIYTVTPKSGITEGACVGAPFSLTVPVNPKPVLLANSISTICNNGLVSFTPNSLTPSVEFSWKRLANPKISTELTSGVNGISETLQNINSDTAIVVYEYTLLANGCENKQYVTVTVNPDPKLSSVKTVKVCSNAILNYNPSSNTSSVSFTWSRAVVSGIRNASNTGTNDILESLVNTTSSPIDVVYKYELTYKGCAFSEDLIVTVDPIPNAVTIPNQTICSGSVLDVKFSGSEIANTAYMWTNNNTNIGLLPNGVGDIKETVTNLSSLVQTAYLTVTPSYNSCMGPSSSFYVSVSASPSLTSNTKPAAICSNTLFNYVPTSNVNGTEFSWSREVIEGISNLAANGVGSINETLINTTSLPITVEYNYNLILNGCVSTSKVSLVVNPLPTVNDIQSFTSCANNLIQIPFTGSQVENTEYRWKNDNTSLGLSAVGISDILFLPILSNGGSQSANIIVTPFANGCSGVSKNFTITVSPSTVLTSSVLTQTICSNSSFKYTPTSTIANTEFSWSRAQIDGIENVAATGTGAIDEVLVNTTANPITVVYMYTLTANGCSSTKELSVTVNPLPSVNAVQNINACGSSLIQISFGGSVLNNTEYRWTNSNTRYGLAASGTGDISFLPTANLTAPQVSNLTVAPFVNGCSGVSKSFTITVSPSPVLTSSVLLQTICSNSNFKYTPTSSIANTEFSWSRAQIEGIENIAATGTGSIDEILVNTTANPITVVYMYTLTANGCSSTRELSVTVNPLPSVNAVQNINACGSSLVQISFGGSVLNNTEYRWTNSNTRYGLAASGIGDISFLPTANLTAPQVSNLTVTPFVNGCSGVSKSFTITVSPSPVLTSSVIPQTICSNSSFKYMPTSSIANTEFSWSRTQIDGIENVAATGTGVIDEVLVNTTANPITVVYVYTLTANGCSSTRELSVIVNPLPTMDKPNDISICNDIVQIGFTGSKVTNTEYRWINSNSNFGLATTGSGFISFIPRNLNSPSQSMFITVTPFANGCSGLSNTFTITLNQFPTLTSSTIQQTICTNSQFAYLPTSNVKGTKFTWKRASVTGIDNPEKSGEDVIDEILINSTSQPIVVTYLLTGVSNNCSFTKEITVLVNPKPFVNNINDISSCGTQIIQIPFTGSQVSNTQYYWTNSNAQIGLFEFGNGNISFTPNLLTTTQSTFIRVTPIANGCSGDSKVFKITVNQVPELTSNLDLQLVCNKTEFSYSPTSNIPGASFVWKRKEMIGIENAASSGTDAIKETLINKSNQPITVTYNYSITAGGCTSNKDISVVVSPVLSFSNPGDKVVCNNTFTTIPLKGSLINGVQFNWYNSNTKIGLMANGIGDLVFVSKNATLNPELTKITVVPELNGCKGDSSIFQVKVMPELQLISNTNLVSICSNGVFEYNPIINSTDSNATIKWFRSNVAGISNSAASGVGSIKEQLVNITSSPIPVTYIFAITADGCTSTQTMVVQVNPAITIANLITNNAICSGQEYQFTPIFNVSSARFQWSRDSVSGITNVASNGNNGISERLINTTDSPIDVNYVFKISNGASCTSEQTVTVTIKPLPVLTSPLAINICGNQSVSYVPESNLSGTSFSWNRLTTLINLPTSNGLGSISEILTNNTSQNINVGYKIDLININGCINSQDLQVQLKPTPTVAFIGDQSICVGSSSRPIQFNDPTRRIQYNWTNSDSSIGLPFSGTGDIPSFLVKNPSNGSIQSNIFVTPILDGCAGNTTLVSRITVNALISGNFIETAPLIACPGQNVGTFVSSAPYGGDGYSYDFQWQISTDSLSYSNINNNLNSGRKLLTIPQSKNSWYRMLVTSGGCQSYTEAVKVPLVSKPSITIFNKDNNTISIGNSTQLIADGATSYQWSPRVNISDAFIYNPFVSPQVNTRYIVTGYNQFGCYDTASVLITVIEGFAIEPNNILTPNGDGFNDTWAIKNIQFYKDNQIKIYNSNGILVKELSNYTGDWDGTVNGSRLNSGTYYYNIKLKNGDVVKKGYITILN